MVNRGGCDGGEDDDEAVSAEMDPDPIEETIAAVSPSTRGWHRGRWIGVGGGTTFGGPLLSEAKAAGTV